ncbi:MAG: hypothetical protein WCK49_05225 [Myxococcaceae bacterium]
MNPLPDQFEVFNLLLKNRRHTMLREAIAYGVAVLCLATAVLAWSRPLPVVVKSDRPDEETYLVEANHDTAVRVIDAKKFFHKKAILMNGWSSPTVLKDLFEASTVMTPKYREKYLAYVNEKVAVDPAVDPSGKTERASVWASQSIDNQLTLDWKETECKPAETRWNCRTTGTLIVRTLNNTAATQSLPVELRASLVEVPTTESTIDGLLIDSFELIKGKV